MKRDTVSAYVLMKCDTLLPLLDDPPSIPLVMYILNGGPISQSKAK